MHVMCSVELHTTLDMHQLYDRLFRVRIMWYSPPLFGVTLYTAFVYAFFCKHWCDWATR